MEIRVRERRLDREIAELEDQLGRLEPGSEPHSVALRQLVALQQEKKALGAR
jgi:hypothetical protein